MPTAKLALEDLASTFGKAVIGPDEQPGKNVIILATDGEPNGCGEQNLPIEEVMKCAFGDINCLLDIAVELGYQKTLAAVYKAREQDIDVYVISLAGNLAGMQRLQKIANVGRGLAEDAAPGAEIFEPGNPDGLRQALQSILGGALTCQIALEGTLDVNNACDPRGKVEINGVPLECDGPNGWRPVDEHTIELLGTSCDDWLVNEAAMLHARFPCDVVRPD